MANYNIPNPINPTYGGEIDARKVGITTLDQLRDWDVVAIPIPDGFTIYIDGVDYKYDVNNEVSETTGKFKAPTSGGGEIPDNSIAEVKLNAELRTKIDSKLDDEDIRSFTQAEWDALTTEQQNSYLLAIVI